MMVRTGTIVIDASTRGVTSFLLGSVPNARIALICSLTSIEPSSDAMPDPTRPATTIAVYSLRAREHPTASIPLHWREVERIARGGDTEKIRFEIPDAIKRIEKEGDLFEPVLKLKQKLPALERLEDA